MAGIKYANRLDFEGKYQMDALLGIMGSWLFTKTKARLNVNELMSNNSWSFSEGHRLQTCVADTAFPALYSIRLQDPPFRGRQWITEIGFRREYESGNIQCTVVVKTEDISARVNDAVQVSPPRFINDLTKAFPALPDKWGLSVTSVKLLDKDYTEGLKYIIDDEERKYPIILVSPTRDGGYLVDVNHLSRLLAGLACVIQIPPDFDTFWMQDVLGEKYAVYHGAINTIYPERFVRGAKVINARKLFLEDIQDIKSEDLSPEKEILSVVTHSTNLPILWKHISPEAVRDVSLRREINNRREEARANGELSEIAEEILAKSDDEKKIFVERIKELEDKNKDLEEQSQTYDDLISSLERDNSDLDRRLKYELETKLPKWQTSESEAGLSQSNHSPLVVTIVKTLGNKLSLEDSLHIVQTSFPERFIVLDTAWKSTKDARKFRHQQKAFELLLKLATDFWQEKLSGKGDIESGRVFGDDFAPRESETTQSNARAIKERTFEYKGENVVMWKHLKHEVKESNAETLRIHFHWDTDEGKVVVGHCGRHLFRPD